MNPILHVVVVGFHHKRGCQVEYCYPPLKDNVVPDPDKDIPEQWVALPSLALPDGVHNVNEDIVYFLLPSLDNPKRAVFGISCYRQVSSADLVTKDKDVTRSSVQKSVCVLSRIPLFGVLNSKLELITQTYFNEKDFSRVAVLHQMYANLCDLFDASFTDAQSSYLGIPLTPLLSTFKHRTLLLFKLLLLERKVMFDVFPVKLLGDMVIGLASLFPLLIENGLFEAASYTVGRIPVVPGAVAIPEDIAIEVMDDDSITVSVSHGESEPESESISKTPENVIKSIGKKISDVMSSEPDVENSFEEAQEAVENDAQRNNPSTFETDEFGFPLSIFTKGSLFHPYLSISYMDMLRSDYTRAFCIGVTNAIFRTKQDMSDVIITVDDKNEGHIDIVSNELKRQLTLTTQDLRFMDFILRMKEMTTDPAVWEGSDNWIRQQFHEYLVSMLAVSVSKCPEAISEFNEDFINAWKTKHNHRVWSCGTHPGMDDVKPNHTFAGQLSVNDVFLRMGHSLNSSEQGRRVISTLSNTGRYVSETGNRFRTSFSSWMRTTAGKLQPDTPHS